VSGIIKCPWQGQWGSELPSSHLGVNWSRSHSPFCGDFVTNGFLLNGMAILIPQNGVIFNGESNENVSVAAFFFQETPQSRMVLSPNRAYGIPQNCHVNEEYDDLPILTAGFSLFACSKKRTSLGSPLVVEASHSSPHSLSWASHCPSRKGHHACASLAVVDHKSKDPGNPKVKRCSRILGIQMTSQH